MCLTKLWIQPLHAFVALTTYDIPGDGPERNEWIAFMQRRGVLLI